jgi:hypothetical protein
MAEHKPASTLLVMSLGQTMLGALVSKTVTLNVHVRVLPAASVAVLVTVDIPSGKAEPDDGLETTVTAEQSSLARTLKFTTAEQMPGSLGIVMLVGQRIVGAVLSSTVTVNEQVDRFPEASVAVVVT